MPDHRRRTLLVALAAALGGGAAGWHYFGRRGIDTGADAAHAGHPIASGSGNALPEATLRLRGRDGLMPDLHVDGPLRLQAAAVDVPLLDGPPTRILAYRGCREGRDCLNPTLHVARGDTLDVVLHNVLEEDTTIHWHGLQVDEANDGSGLHPVAAGAERRYRFEVRNRAGLYWYHAHPHLRTGRQLQLGLAGLLVIEDEEERALRDQLGLVWGERDLVLMLADKQIGHDNAIAYRDGADDWIGNRALVNWSPEPTATLRPGLHRLRLLNASNARLLRPALLHEGAPLPMTLIGTDGGLLDRAQTIEDLFLAPAQRADVLVDFSSLPPGANLVLRSLDYTAMENEDESGPLAADMMADHPGAAPMGAPLDLMRFRIEGASLPPVVVPERLSSLPPPPDVDGWPVRPIRLSMGADGEWLINGLNFHTHGHAPAFTIERGAREVWEIRNNMTSMPHPIHIHGLQFRLLSRSISPTDIRARSLGANGLGAQDLGLHDTVLIWPGEIVRIAVDCMQPFSGTQRYMIHCHNLEHEDMGMMLTFAISD
jgi:bilirubin oxidase